MHKQNVSPTKQGIFYQLHLSKSYGAFLPKDIMHNNPKSISLLTGTEIIKSFSSLNQTLNNISNKEKSMKEQFCHVESLNATFFLHQEELQSLDLKNNQLKAQERQLKAQLQSFNEAINTTNYNLLQENLPHLKSLYKVVKEVASSQRQINYKIQRQLAEIALTKKVILDGILLCQEKIQKIEIIIGEDFRRKAGEKSQRDIEVEEA